MRKSDLRFNSMHAAARSSTTCQAVGCASISLVIRAASVDSSTFRLFCGGLHLTLITVLSVRFLSRLETLTDRFFCNLQCDSQTFTFGLALTSPLDLTLKSVISVRCRPSARYFHAAVCEVDGHRASTETEHTRR